MRIRVTASACAIALLGWAGNFYGTVFAQNFASESGGIPALQKGLPSGWAVVEQTKGEIPWGHHFCWDYIGIKGTKVTITAPKPVSVAWISKVGEAVETVVAVESIELWFMPPDYSDRWNAWTCFHRPAQPLKVFSDSNILVYGRTSHRLKSEREFREQVLRQAKSVSWPDSPTNDPSRLSWINWSSEIGAAVRHVRRP